MRRRHTEERSVMGCFNPRICKRCDYTSEQKSKLISVSIHASVKDATKRPEAAPTPALSFNPRICKRCDRQTALDWWGRVGFNPRICKRCDSCRLVRLHSLFSFNPRICKRCDYTFPMSYAVNSVSIHASVKDATLVSFFHALGF